MSRLKLVPTPCANCGRTDGHAPHCPNGAQWPDPLPPPDIDLETTPAERGWLDDAERDARAATETDDTAADTVPPPASEAATWQTHCGCGAEHGKQDSELRSLGGMPLQAVTREGELDHRYAWPCICRNCGAVYCKIWQPLEAHAR